ncbi:MAG: site-specific integrase, partial [Peptococcus niger]
MSAEQLTHFLDELAFTRRLSPNTVEAYRRDLEQYLAWLQQEGLSLERVTYTDARLYLYELGTKDYAKSTVARKLSAIRSWYRYMAGQGQLVDNPWQDLT